jgi:Lipase (class 3)
LKLKGMDPDTAIEFGLLIVDAYSIEPGDLNNRKGQEIAQACDPFGRGYKIVSTIYASDLATDINPDRGKDLVSLGFVAQNTNGDAVVALRGTEGIWEWLHDAEFLEVPCPFPSSGAGMTEDGFTSMYRSLSLDENPGAMAFCHSLSTLAFITRPVSLTICGHSLGAALATMLALDVTVNNKALPRPTAYTFASPRVGDFFFAHSYDKRVKQSFRIFNRADIVSMLPLPLPVPYEHTDGGFPLNPIGVKRSLECQHSMATYLHLLGKLPGATVTTPLEPQCV